MNTQHTNTIAGNARHHMHQWLLRFVEQKGSRNAAATILKTDGLSFQWIKGFASGQIRNPTVDKLQKLEQRLIEIETVNTKHQ